MNEDRNGRTHEPSLRELTAELDGIRYDYPKTLAELLERLSRKDKK